MAAGGGELTQKGSGGGGELTGAGGREDFISGGDKFTGVGLGDRI